MLRIIQVSALGADPQSRLRLLRWHWRSRAARCRSLPGRTVLRPALCMQVLLKQAVQITCSGKIEAPARRWALAARRCARRCRCCRARHAARCAVTSARTHRSRSARLFQHRAAVFRRRSSDTSRTWMYAVRARACTTRGASPVTALDRSAARVLGLRGSGCAADGRDGRHSAPSRTSGAQPHGVSCRTLFRHFARPQTPSHVCAKGGGTHVVGNLSVRVSARALSQSNEPRMRSMTCSAVARYPVSLPP